MKDKPTQPNDRTLRDAVAEIGARLRRIAPVRQRAFRRWMLRGLRRGC